MCQLKKHSGYSSVATAKWQINPNSVRPVSPAAHPNSIIRMVAWHFDDIAVSMLLR